MIVREVHDAGEFEGLAEDWNNLLDRTLFPTVFQTWEWAFTWWKHFSGGKQLRILVAYDNRSQLVGIAPLYQVRKRFGLLGLRTMEFLGYGENKNSEYLDFILDRDAGVKVEEAFAKYLLSERPGWDLLNLTNVREDSVTLEGFARLLKGKRTLVDENLPCPYILLPESLDKLLMTFKTKPRGNLRNERNRLLKTHQVEIVQWDGTRLAEGVDLLFELHLKRFGAQSAFYSEGNKIFFKDVSTALFHRQLLKLYVMKIDGEYACATLCLGYGERILSYQNGYDQKWLKQNASKVLLYEIIQDLIHNNYSEFDFGRGGEDYKLHWTKTLRRTKDLLVFRRELVRKIFQLQRDVYRAAKGRFRKTG